MTSEDLLERLKNFAKYCQKLCKELPRTEYNVEYKSQLIRSSASSGSNYIEALEATSPKDFCYRLKVCRKETRESEYWLSLIQNSNEEVSEIHNKTDLLIKESIELIRIFTSSIITSEKNQRMNKISK